MNKEQYKKALSGVRPSEEAMERILAMNETKKVKKVYVKGLIAAAVILIIMICGVFTANAATDSAVFEAVSLKINGEDVDFVEYINNYKKIQDADGNTAEVYEFALPEDASDIAMSFGGGSGDVGSVSVEKIDGEMESYVGEKFEFKSFDAD